MRAVLPVLMLVALAGAAEAHAMLERAEPRVGNTVAAMPKELRLWFTEKLEPAFSKVTVTGPSGQVVSSGRPAVSGSEMSVALRGSAKGTYKVNWHAVSTDAHTTQGSFTFTVGP